MKPLLFHPRDVLFFRDAKPLGGSSAGDGARWPLPSVLHSAILSAFHERWPDGVDSESQHHRRDGENAASFRFGGLRTLGPFPACWEKGGRWTICVPTPADLTAHGRLLPVEGSGGWDGNLPEPLRYAVANSAPPSKETLGSWIALDQLARYLRDSDVEPETIETDTLYASEARPGVGIDPETHANREHIFYQAEYLRLRENVAVAAWIDALARRHRAESATDLLAEWLRGEEANGVILGGQGGLAWTDERPLPPSPLDIPLPDTFPGGRVKWVLLTPALFNAGWRPGWANADGNVQLRAQRPPRKAGESRQDWRDRVSQAPAVRADLVAAAIPKPVPVSGWKLDAAGDRAGGGPKATRLLVPAGAVYYFQCPDADSARALAFQLHARVRSDLLGEQGFGFGVCGAWNFLNLSH